MPQDSENVERFGRRQRKLLNRLFQALQVEVDSPKSAERLEDIKEIGGENLLADAKKWSESHPSYFFDFKKDERLYRSFAMPADAPGSINVIARVVVNPLWEPTRIRSRDRHEFRYLFPKETLSVDALEWADELKTRFQQARDQIKERVGDDREAFNEELGKLYESYRAEIDELFPTSEERFVSRADKLRQCVASRTEGAAALWHTQHTRPELDRHRKDCLKLAEQMEITFSFQHDYELPSVALPQDIYVLSVPFGAGAIKWKESLEQKGIKFDATIHPQLPLIEFALKDLSPKVVDKLAAKFGENINDLDELNIPKDLRIIPPADHSWATSRQDSGVGALAYNLFTEEVCQQLQDFQFDEIKVLGIKYNHFANENFASKQWKKRSVTLEVGVFELPESHPEHYRYNGTPILQIDGKNLGTFAPDSPKLPIGATFAATLQPDGSSVILKVNPESINLPEVPLPESEPTLDTAGQFRAIHRELWRKEMFDNLVGAIATTYEQRQANQFASNEIEQFQIGSHWAAYVQSSGDFIVRNEGKRTICRGNLQTGEEIFPLSEERASELEAMILKRERLLHRKHEPSHNGHHISSHNIELN